jgi:hypothetical protein
VFYLKADDLNASEVNWVLEQTDSYGPAKRRYTGKR